MKSEKIKSIYFEDDMREVFVSDTEIQFCISDHDDGFFTTLCDFKIDTTKMDNYKIVEKILDFNNKTNVLGCDLNLSKIQKAEVCYG